MEEKSLLATCFEGKRVLVTDQNIGECHPLSVWLRTYKWPENVSYVLLIGWKQMEARMELQRGAPPPVQEMGPANPEQTLVIKVKNASDSEVGDDYIAIQDEDFQLGRCPQTGKFFLSPLFCGLTVWDYMRLKERFNTVSLLTLLCIVVAFAFSLLCFLFYLALTSKPEYSHPAIIDTQMEHAEQLHA